MEDMRVGCGIFTSGISARNSSYLVDKRVGFKNVFGVDYDVLWG